MPQKQQIAIVTAHEGYTVEVLGNILTFSSGTAIGAALARLHFENATLIDKLNGVRECLAAYNPSTLPEYETAFRGLKTDIMAEIGGDIEF